MNKLVCFIALCILITGCRSDDKSVYSEAAVQSITGKWKLVAEEQGLIGQAFWNSIKEDSTRNISFRSDGVLFDSQGLPACCAPASLTINGFFFEVKPKDPLPSNQSCASIKCATCPNWEIQLSGNEMIITSCGNSRRKYTRL